MNDEITGARMSKIQSYIYKIEIPKIQKLFLNALDK